MHPELETTTTKYSPSPPSTALPLLVLRMREGVRKTRALGLPAVRSLSMSGSD